MVRLLHIACSMFVVVRRFVEWLSHSWRGQWGPGPASGETEGPGRGGQGYGEGKIHLKLAYWPWELLYESRREAQTVPPPH